MHSHEAVSDSPRFSSLFLFGCVCVVSLTSFQPFWGENERKGNFALLSQLLFREGATFFKVQAATTPEYGREPSWGSQMCNSRGSLSESPRVDGTILHFCCYSQPLKASCSFPGYVLRNQRLIGASANLTLRNQRIIVPSRKQQPFFLKSRAPLGAFPREAWRTLPEDRSGGVSK